MNSKIEPKPLRRNKTWALNRNRNKKQELLEPGSFIPIESFKM